MALSFQLDEDGDLTLKGGGPKLVSGAEAARTALIYRFNTQAGTSLEDPGEWAYDYNYGVLWRQVVFGRYFRLDETQAHLAAVASQTTGVAPTGAYQVVLEVESNTRTQRVKINRLRTTTGATTPEPVSVPVL